MRFFKFFSNCGTRAAIKRLDHKITILLEIGNDIMATQAELDAKLDEMAAEVSKELQQLADAINQSAPDLAPQVAKVQAMIDSLRSDNPA